MTGRTGPPPRGAGEDAGDPYDRAPCGLLTITRAGDVRGANRTFLDWLGLERSEEAPRFPQLLRVGDRIFWETHLAPLLAMQGEVREIAVELTTPSGPLPALLNARLRPGAEPALVDIAVFAARDRRSYENELLRVRREAEAAEARARRLAQTLQHSLIPPSLPDVPNFELGAAYRPVGEGAEVGGDFYDIFQVAPGDWMVAVGDVCGKGPEAAALTALARYTIRGAAMETSSVAEVLNAVNTTLLLDRSDRTYTAILCRFLQGVDGPLVTVCSAGHPLARHITPTGRVATVGRPGTLLGAFRDADQREERLDLEAGGTLVFLTDGLTDARRDGEFFGEKRLQDVLASSARLAAAELATTVADAAVAYQDGNARDDVAVVVVRRSAAG